MGFWQDLVDSYDKNAEALKKTYPLSTTSISNNSGIIAIVVIDGDGKFIRFDKFDKRSNATKKSPGIPVVNITIPASEESLKRTSTSISPYPVFEQYEYIKGIGGKSKEYINKFYRHCDYIRGCVKKLKNGKKDDKSRLKKWEDYSARIKKLETLANKYDAYIGQLKNFAESDEFATEQVKAIYKYVKKRSIASDLSEMKLNDKTNIIFQVEISDNPQTKIWEDQTLFNAWHQYYLAEKHKRGEESLDYVTGTLQTIATFHPKKISKYSANAKLVSANDKTNFTFRGKFAESSEAVSIGYQTTHKAHQFLRYLINDKDRRYSCGEQVIFSFTIGSTEKLLPPPIEDNSICGILQESQAKTQSEIQIELRAETGFDYADSLRKSLGGFRYRQALKQHPKTAVVALDAVSDKSGRLAITFYRELDRNEYLEKIAEWHSGCKWHQKFWDETKEKYVSFVGAPSVDKIIAAVHGIPRGGKDESYTKIKKAARERLLRCIFDGAFFPKDYVVAAVRRASNPLGITKGGKFDPNTFEQVVSTACALVRKDYLQRDKEDYKLSIELNRTDREYLYGRLLGAADKLEEYALYKKDNDRVVTAAIRYMQAYAQRPFRTWLTIHSCLNPYIQKVKGSFAFAEIEAVMGKFESGDYEKDVQLNGSFLIGYYHERAYIDSLVKAAGNKKKSTDSTEKENNNDR